MKIALGELWNTMKKLRQPTGHKNQDGPIRKLKNFMCVILSSSLALLHTKRDPLGHDLPLQGKESKRTPAALTIGMKSCSFCH